MNETNFDWDDLRLFLAVARTGGLAAATSATGKSAPTLGRRMLHLERRLGRELFQRLPRGYELTDEGRALLGVAAALESRIAPLAANDAAKSGPLVKVSAGTWVTHVLCNHVPELIKSDRIRLRFISANEVLDIGRREAVIGVRNRRPDQAGLAGRRITQVRFAVYALHDAVDDWAGVLDKTPSARWVQDRIDDVRIIEVTSPRNALDLALAGTARAVLPTFIGKSFGTLKQVSPPIDALEHDQWLVTHHEDRFIPAVRRTIDRIYQTLRRVIPPD